MHAVQLYESAILLVLLLLLSRVHWRRVAAGSIAVISISSYALLRFFMEILRADNTALLGNLTVTQILCILLIPSVLLLPYWRKSIVS